MGEILNRGPLRPRQHCLPQTKLDMVHAVFAPFWGRFGPLLGPPTPTSLRALPPGYV